MPQLLDVWGKRSSGDEATVIQTVTESDVDYLCNYVCPFIQIINSKMSFESEFTLKLVKSIWIINDFNDAISTSAPSVELASIAHQAAIAKEIMKRIMDKNWPAIEIISGTPLLERFVWIEARRARLEVGGYTPTPKEEEVCKRLSEHLRDGESWEYPRPEISVEPKVRTAK